jgi:uncharacterized C2H2 Zn-finger protein
MKFFDQKNHYHEHILQGKGKPKGEKMKKRGGENKTNLPCNKKT